MTQTETLKNRILDLVKELSRHGAAILETGHPKLLTRLPVLSPVQRSLQAPMAAEAAGPLPYPEQLSLLSRKPKSPASLRAR